MKFLKVFGTTLLIVVAVRPGVSASEVGGLALATGAKAAKPVVDVVSSVAEVPLAVADLVRLPLGVVQIGLSPLPGIGIIGGLENVGQGILAPFKLVQAVLTLPHDLVGGMGKACDSAGSGL